MAHGSQLPRPLHGIIPPMVTPLSDRDTLDLAGLERLIEHILAGGVQGLFILGTTGEGPSLSYRLRCQLIDRVCEQVAERVPILVSISDTSLVESLNLAEYAADAGAQAVVLAPPYYFPAGQAELLKYVEHIASELPLPVFLYNLPSHTKLCFEPETLRRLIEIPNITGLKDSSGDMIYFHQVWRLAEERADWTLLIGPEELLAEAVLLGAHGGVPGGANLCPRLYVDLYQAASRGQLARVRQLHARVMQIHRRVYCVAGDRATGAPPQGARLQVVPGLKCALRCLGICDDFLAPPLQRLDDGQRRLIQEHLADAQGSMLNAEC
jgi:dihydrodipicolinate synthase/N-acetylneuraminate lyase